MAKQHPESPRPKKNPPQDEPEIMADSDVAKADDAGAAKKTQLSKKSSQPTQLPKKAPQPTQLAPDSAPGLDTPPRAPKMSSNDDEVVEAEAADSDVVEAQPASDVSEDMIVDAGATKSGDDEDVFTAAEVEAEQQAAGHAAPETPVRAEQAVEAEEVATADEDAVGAEPFTARTESSVRVKGKKRPELEATEMFEGIEQPADEIEKTVPFEAMGVDESSAVDLGKKPPKKKGGSHAGVDEVAEALESGVQLEASAAPPPKRKPEPSVEFDDLVAEEGEMPKGPPSDKKREAREDATDPDMVVRKDAEEAAAADLPSEGAKTVDEEAADLWNKADEPAAASAKAEPTTPAPGKKKGKTPAAAKTEDETEAAALEAPAPRRRPGGGTAVMARPRKPKYGRRWLGGMLLGIILAAGALVGLRYYDPDLLDPAYALLPEAKQPKAELDLKAAQDAVKRSRADLETAQTEKSELDKTLEAKTEENKKLGEKVASLAASEKSLSEVRDLLAKKMIIDDKTDVKEFAKAIGQTLAVKEEKEKLLHDIEKTLGDAKQLTGKLDVAAIGKIVKDLGDKQATLTAVNKLLEGAMIKAAGPKGVEQLLAAQKDLDNKLMAVNKVLTDEKIKGEGAAGLKEIVTLRHQLQKDRDELDKAVKDAYKELADGQFAPAKGDPRQQLLAGTKAARQRAESPLAIPLTQLATKIGSLGLNPAANTKSTFEVAALMAEVNFYRLREPLIQSPVQKLDTYLTLHQRRGRGDAKEQALALKDAAWVLSKDAKASATAQAKAHAVRGLILRNQEKFSEAKEALQAAVAAPVPNPGPWAARAKLALAELSDPTAYYLPYIGELRSAGLADLAKQELATALKAMPNDGRLLAQRALFRLEEARGTGKFAADAQAAVRQDADAALKNPKTAADGTFVLGLLEEELGNLVEAEQLFRQALKTHQGSADEAARFRIALARVLQRDRAPVAAPSPAPKKNEKKAADATGAEEVRQAFPLALALLIAQVGADEEDNPAAAARLTESIKLAKELIDSANPKIKGQGHMLLGQALAKQGKRTEGVREYVRGMEMLFPGMASKEMAQILEEHPAFQQPDATKAPSAYLAEVHFGKGLHLYWSRQYPEAESQFAQAAGFYSQDARYQYFLGLAQYAQKTKVKRDAAIFSFEKGANLEAANRPPAREINTSLERIQGDLRKLINSFRTKAIELRN